MISPQKSASGQRVYRRSDVETVLLIKHLLYEERFSIEGARKRLRELRKDGGLKNYKQEKLWDRIAAIFSASLDPKAALPEADEARSEAPSGPSLPTSVSMPAGGGSDSVAAA